jgi:signal transduction histidine kinase
LFSKKPLAVDSLLSNVHSILGERAQAKGLQFVVETPPALPALLGDPTRLQQALLNYVTNAIKFTSTGSVTLRVVVLAQQAESVALRFEVQDTGMGIDAETLPRLFSAFEQGIVRPLGSMAVPAWAWPLPENWRN